VVVVWGAIDDGVVAALSITAVRRPLITRVGWGGIGAVA
jgi:hypothetical protein